MKKTMRKTGVAVLASLALLFSGVTDASAGRPGNIYNNSDHGMWFLTNHEPNGPLKWVPAKRWSRDVGVVAAGAFTGAGWCMKLYSPDGAGGWRERKGYKGPYRVKTDLRYEWMVYEYPC